MGNEKGSSRKNGNSAVVEIPRIWANPGKACQTFSDFGAAIHGGIVLRERCQARETPSYGPLIEKGQTVLAAVEIPSAWRKGGKRNGNGKKGRLC